MIIGISGKARSGKDTFAGYLGEALFDLYGSAYVKMAFATELKNRVQNDFNLTWDQLWGDKKEFADIRYFNTKTERYWTGREILQEYGNFYRSIDKSFWINILFNRISDNEYKNVIITDLRYKDEVEATIKAGGIHIRMERLNKDEITNSTHISETSLDDGYEVDFIVHNNSDLNSLNMYAKDLVLKLKNYRRN